MTKILLGALAILLIIVYFGYKEIAILQQNNATLTTAVETKDALIAKREKEFRKQSEALLVLNQKNNEITKKNHDLEKLFAEHDLEKLLRARPTLMGKKMTKATEELGKELEAITLPESYNE